jgi:TolB-like protein
MLPLLVWMGFFSSIAPQLDAAPKAVAVLDFDNNSGDTRYDPLGKGIAAMMISDLSGVSALKLVERQKLQDLIRETELQQSKYFDPATAQKLGRLIGAEYMVVGSIVALQPEIRIDTRVVNVSTAEIVKTSQVKGKENKFFDLQQKLASQLIDGLEIALSPEDRELLLARQEANRIEALQTTLAYSEALALWDREDYLGASARMYYVMQHAPGSAVVRLTYDEMKRRAAQNARQKAGDKVRDLMRKRFP